MCGGSNGSSVYIAEPGPDGITDGYNMMQGLRNYDPAMGTWSTPDAYAGEVGNPMSQKGYAWNRDNSFEYEDPSGYCGATINPGDPSCAIVTEIVHPKAPLPMQATPYLAGFLTPLRGSTVYFATETASGDPYIGMTFDDQFRTRAARQLAKGRIIHPLVRGLTRAAARGLEQALIERGGLSKLENVINSIAPSNPAYEQSVAQGTEEVESQSPGLWSQLLTWVQAIVDDPPAGGILPF